MLSLTDINKSNDKICAILAHGRSLEELERRIDEFKDFDIIWCGMNCFNPSEEILKKIGKEFMIVFDCATVANDVEYELKVRLPRLTEYLSRPNKNIYMTLRNSLYELRNRIGSDFNERFKEKVIYAGDLGFDTTQFFVSLPLYIISLFKIGAKNMILFGADGFGTDRSNTTNFNNIESYYRPNIILEERIFSGIDFFDTYVDNERINTSFIPMAQQILGYIPDIINCSPNSYYTAFKKMNYDDTINWLKDKRR